MNRHRFLRLVVFLLLAALPLVAQEQTSSITGIVTDPSGAVLPGVTVEAKRSAGGATLTAQTDSEGRYRFPSVPPGTYVVTASLQGMESAAARNVDAKLGGSPRVDLQMRLSAVAETISVTAEAPLVDVTSSATSASITSETFDRLPKGRDFTSVVTQAAAANNDPKAGGITIDGASGSENRYVLDGVDVTNPQTGVSGKTVITDFIEEVQVKSAGYAAEFGGATGGVINLITKTGTNDFRGSAGVYYSDNEWNGDSRPSMIANATALTYRTFDKDDETIIEPGVALGGPIVRDRLWFFGAYEPIIRETNRTVTFATPGAFPATNTFGQDFTRENYAGTLSGALGTKFLFKLSGNSSGYEEENLLPGLSGAGSSNPAQYAGRVDNFDNWTMSGYADFVATQDWMFSLRGGRFYRNFSQSGYATDPRIGWLDGTFPGLTSGGARVFPEIPDSLLRPAGFSTIPTNTSTAKDAYTRDNANFDISWFPQFAGTHRIKFGVQKENLNNEVNSGFQNYFIRTFWNRGTRFTPNTPAGRGKYGAAEVYRFATEGMVDSNNLGFFIQDSWTTMNDRLTLNLGVRTEKEQVPNYNTNIAGSPKYAIEFGYGDKVAPRLGFSYDIRGDGKWKAYGSFGTFYDITKLEMPRGSFGGDKWINWQFMIDDYDWTKWTCTNVTNNLSTRPSCTGMTLIGGIDLRAVNYDLIEPDLKPMESREYTLGLQHEFTNTIAIGARYVHKELIRTIEDVGVLVDHGDGTSSEEYFTANPGEGIARSILGAAFPDFPKPVRDYDAIELEATKRFVNRWSLHASYVYSRLYGNYSGLANSDEAQATPGSARTSPNVNRFGDSLFNMFDAKGNAVFGRLATDRPHQFKAQVVYAFPFGTSLGLNQYLASGTPFSTEYYYHGVPFFPNGRGDLGRGPNFKQTDFYAQHDLRLFGNYTLQLGLNVLNLLDADDATNIYDAVSTTNVNPCAGIAGTCDQDTQFFKGFNPAASIGTADVRYNQPNAFQAPREVRVHVKFIF